MTDALVIAQRFAEAYDVEYQRSLYRQIKYAFGEDWTDTCGDVKRGSTHDFPPIKVQRLALGRTRRLMVSQIIDVTRNCYSDPTAEFPGVDKYTGCMRSKFLNARFKNGWSKAVQRTFVEGNGVGQSFLRIGLVPGANGSQRVEVEHASALHVFYDPHAASFEDARYVFVQVNMPYDDAIKIWPNLEEKQVNRDAFREAKRKRRTVKVFEYHDNDGEAGTRAVFIQDVDETNPQPVELTENPFFPELPVAAYEHILVPWLDRPIGRIPLLMATQESENEILTYIRRTLQRTGYDAIVGNADPEELEKVMDGVQDFLVMPDGGPANPIQRVPAAEIPQTALMLLQRLQQQFDEESGTSSYDRGSMPTGERTKYEVQAYMNRQGGQGSWAARQTARMYSRLFDKVALIASRYDTEPTVVDVYGDDVVLNDPNDPRLSLSQVFADHSDILVSERSLTYMDQQAKRQERVGELIQLGEMLIPLGQIDARSYTLRMLEEAGVTDPEEWLVQAMPQMQQLAPGGGQPSPNPSTLPPDSLPSAA